MAIKLTLVFPDKKLDIQVNKEQRIEETLEILSDSGVLSFREDADRQTKTLHSMRRKEQINIKLTYEQAHIYTGDILYL